MGAVYPCRIPGKIAGSPSPARCPLPVRDRLMAGVADWGQRQERSSRDTSFGEVQLDIGCRIMGERGGYREIGALAYLYVRERAWRHVLGQAGVPFLSVLV